MRRNFLSLLVSMRKILRDIRRNVRSGGTYKREKHYMRGPGPKHMAKHGVLADRAVRRRKKQPRTAAPPGK
jgi:hypothetical protein